MAKINLQNLEMHPFYVEVDKNFIPLVKKINLRNKDIDTLFVERNIPKKVDFTSQEYYCYHVFGKLLTFSNIYRTLKQAQLYISKFHSPRRHEEQGIYQFDWLTYHYAIHVITYVAI